jgi:hypothetical protein
MTAMAASDSEYVVTVISNVCVDLDNSVHDFVIGKLLNRGYATTAIKFQKAFATTTGAGGK